MGLSAVTLIYNTLVEDVMSIKVAKEGVSDERCKGQGSVGVVGTTRRRKRAQLSAKPTMRNDLRVSHSKKLKLKLNIKKG